MAWTNATLSPRKYLQATSSEITMTSGAAINSDPFDFDLSGNGYLWLGVKITTLGSDVATTLKLQTSYDGVTYTNALTLSSDLDPHLVGFKMFYVDLTSYTAPYMRMVFNDAGVTNPGATGKFIFYYISRILGTASDPYAS